ncbi:hypothetical protein I3843_14G055600 [Carya illinoinensis]|uniref:Secreted protein n=1 Tax=Carya illinoinensis TaxID=32201 RepID=A0A922D8Q0_CARIL|nr:hypothetical protein I3842_14G056800 [Carya illinoinensis]KAG7946711.1 hypothetical protein I3843_14G055600 [Carya illinoinensis]
MQSFHFHFYIYLFISIIIACEEQIWCNFKPFGSLDDYFYSRVFICSIKELKDQLDFTLIISFNVRFPSIPCFRCNVLDRLLWALLQSVEI